jgi:hypothetical protein
MVFLVEFFITKERLDYVLRRAVSSFDLLFVQCNVPDNRRMSL